MWEMAKKTTKNLGSKSTKDSDENPVKATKSLPKVASVGSIENYIIDWSSTEMVENESSIHLIKQREKKKF